MFWRIYDDGLNLYWIYALLLNVCCPVIAWIEKSWLVSNILAIAGISFFEKCWLWERKTRRACI